MIVSKLAIAAGVVVLGVLCWLAATGLTPVAVILVTGGALVVLVGGGNWLSGRTVPRSAPPTPPTPTPPTPTPPTPPGGGPG